MCSSEEPKPDTKMNFGYLVIFIIAGAALGTAFVVSGANSMPTTTIIISGVIGGIIGLIVTKAMAG